MDDDTRDIIFLSDEEEILRKEYIDHCKKQK